MSKTLDKHKHLLNHLSKQSKEQALKGLNELLKMKLIGKIGYRLLKKELNIDDNTTESNNTNL